jgi:hypothetical protein
VQGRFVPATPPRGAIVGAGEVRPGVNMRNEERVRKVR